MATAKQPLATGCSGSIVLIRDGSALPLSLGYNPGASCVDFKDDMKTTHKIVLTDEFIAEAQRIAIAQNTVLRLMYQTWWIRWIPRFIFAGAAIAFWILNSPLFALFLALMFGLSFLGQYLVRRNLAKARREFRAKGTTTTVSMDENGIDTLGAFGNSHLKWVAVLKPTIYSNGVLIKLSRLSMLWLPDQSLIEGTPAEVRQLLADSVKDATPGRSDRL
jgi:hypothetical protein